MTAPLNGLRIIESQHALEKTKRPVREHTRRRWMSTRYHERIQKKWLKRFGTVLKPCMYRVSPRHAGLAGDDYLVVHPALMAQVRAAISSQEPK